jgi:SAM-dependent methyltransferase
MDDLALLVDLHREGARQGPGSEAETRRAVALSRLAPGAGLRIADVGCGTGASALVLARELGGRITAVDLVPEFLASLEERARTAGLSDRIETLAAPMDALPFEEGSLDAIWSEGAIYSMGFAAGVAAWRRFLRPGGVLAVSELTWLTRRRPADLTRHWTAEYAEVDLASAKIAVLEDEGYAPLGHFVLPRSCWTDGYYDPLRERLPAFLARHPGSEAAATVAAAEEAEIALHERHGHLYGYGFYVAARTDAPAS